MAVALDITPEMEALLKAGAANTAGRCHELASDVRKNWPAISEALARGYMVFRGNHATITDSGRKAIGAQSELEADVARFRQMCRHLKPRKDSDPRSNVAYRAWSDSEWCCTLVIRLDDYRPNSQTIPVCRDLDSKPQYLGAGNSSIQPESEGRFVLAVVPPWMVRARWKDGAYTAPIFASWPRELNASDQRFTDDERALWNRLRTICFSVNSRIRTAGRKVRADRMRFGESA